MHQIALRSVVFHGPHDITLEASDKMIVEQGLNELEGEHFQPIQDVIALDITADAVKISTCRTLRNRDRYEITFPRDCIAKVHVKD